MAGEAANCNWVDMLTMVGTLSAAGAAIWYARDNNQIKKKTSETVGILKDEFQLHKETVEVLKNEYELHRDELQIAKQQMQVLMDQNEIAQRTQSFHEKSEGVKRKSENNKATPQLKIYTLRIGNDNLIIHFGITPPMADQWPYHSFNPLAVHFDANTGKYRLCATGKTRSAFSFDFKDGPAIDRSQLVDRIKRHAANRDFQINEEETAIESYLAVIVNARDNQFRVRKLSKLENIHEANPLIHMELVEEL